MHDVMLSSGRDTIALGVVLVLILFFVHFRLDEFLFRSKKRPSRQRPQTATVIKRVCYDTDPDPYMELQEAPSVTAEEQQATDRATEEQETAETNRT